MRLGATRALWCGLASVWAALFAAGCVTATGAGASDLEPVQPAERPAINHAPRPVPVARTPARPTSCPVPARGLAVYDLGQLPVFTKALFYVREDSPVDPGPRSREMLIGALQAVALQEKGIVVEGDSAEPPRWVTVTARDQRCTLNLDGVDAPWALRAALQNAVRFVQANLGPASAAVEPADRLLRVEIAATNGMLSALDGRSVLLDAETYRRVRHPRSQQEQAGTASAESLSIVPQQSAPGLVVGSARLGSFGPDVSAKVEGWLAKSEAEHAKGLILDLRDNPGGLLEPAIKVADAFIKEGSLGAAVTRERRGEQRKNYMARNDGHEPGGALVVLVNHRTSAAAELVAAALKNLGRGLVIGERTAGGATIRVMFDLPVGPLRSPEAHHPDPDPNRDVIQDVIDGKAPAPPAVVPVQPERDPEPLGLVLVTGRLLASGGSEIEGVGVAPDVQPACPPNNRLHPDEDCLLLFARELILRAKDPRRSTLLSIAKELTSRAGIPSTPM